MVRIITNETQNKTVPTEYYTNKVEFTPKGNVIFWDEELKDWIVLNLDEIMFILG